MKYIIQIFFIFSSFYFSLHLSAYFTFEFFCVDDTIDRIKYSGGEIKPYNPQTVILLDINYIFYFPELKHSLNENLCIYLYNIRYPGFFACKKALVNEYDITEIEYENFWECSNCNINSPYKYTYNEKCNNKPKIYLSYYYPEYVYIYNDFCLKPTDDISIFNKGEQYINNNYYGGKTINIFLNDEIDKFKIDNIFQINGKPNNVFD